MDIDLKYEGWKKWKPGVKQHVIPDRGESKAEAILFMRYHLTLFGRDDLTFKDSHVVKEGREYIFTFIANVRWKKR